MFLFVFGWPPDKYLHALSLCCIYLPFFYKICAYELSWRKVFLYFLLKMFNSTLTNGPYWWYLNLLFDKVFFHFFSFFEETILIKTMFYFVSIVFQLYFISFYWYMMFWRICVHGLHCCFYRNSFIIYKANSNSKWKHYRLFRTIVKFFYMTFVRLVKFN